MREKHRAAIVLAERQGDSEEITSVAQGSAIRPALVIYGLVYRVCRRGCGEHIDYQCLVPSPYRHIHFPLHIWRPVPVELIFAVPAVPGPFDALPQFGRKGAKTGLVLIRVREILSQGQYALNHESGLDQVSPIVIGGKGNGLAAVSIEPVRPGPVETFGFVLEEVQHLQAMGKSLLAADPSPLDSDRYGHKGEAAASRGNRITGALALTCKTGDRMRIIPEIEEGGFLYLLEKLVPAYAGELVGRVVFCSETENKLIRQIHAEVLPGAKSQRDAAEGRQRSHSPDMQSPSVLPCHAESEEFGAASGHEQEGRVESIDIQWLCKLKVHIHPFQRHIDRHRIDRSALPAERKRGQYGCRQFHGLLLAGTSRKQEGQGRYESV